MKKIYFFAGVLLFALTAAAQDLTIPKFSAGEAPEIDGVVDAIWSDIAEVEIAIESTDDYGDASINEGWFKMGWNDTALFMLLRRDDDDFATQWVTGLEDWKSDRDEIFLDVNVDTLQDGRGASDAQSGASYGHYQFTSIWVQATDEWVGWPNQWYHNAPFKFGYVVDGNAYYTEYAWPFTSLTINTTLLPSADETFQGAEGVIFGMEVVISDVDMSDSPTDETFRKFLHWAGEGGWESMDSCGTVLMGAEITGIDNNIIKTDVSVYPSPAIDYIMLSNLSKLVDIEVYDVVGHVVLSQNNVSSETKVDINSLDQGIYFIKLRNKEPIRFIKK